MPKAPKTKTPCSKVPAATKYTRTRASAMDLSAWSVGSGKNLATTLHLDDSLAPQNTFHLWFLFLSPFSTPTLDPCPSHHHDLL
ncbi:hypothetical protein BDD12DRAFT_851834 [Trichophaea hybrida]|nr:hypothetical protein BDD12DRAFT_851834 [Trichophaea hybrida]